MIRRHASRALLFVVLLAPALTAQRRFTPTRDLVIDGEAHDLLPIEEMRVADDGTIVALSFDDMVLRFFSADGKDAGRFGRKGEGPGEFKQPGFLGWIGRTLWVFDPITNRITWIGPDRKLARSERVPPELRAPAGQRDQRAISGQPVIFDVAAGGDRIVGYETQTDNPPAWLPFPGAEMWASIVVTDSASRFRRRLHLIDLRRLREREPACAVPRMVGDCEHMVSQHPTAVLAVTILRAPSGSDRRFRLIAIDAATGDTTADRLISYRRTPIPDSVKQRINATRRPGTLPAVFPDAFPPVRRVLIGRDGTIWLLEGGPWGAPAQQWRIFDRRGEELGVAAFPKGVKILVVRRDTAWGTQRDENDVESIVRFRLR